MNLCKASVYLKVRETILFNQGFNLRALVCSFCCPLSCSDLQMHTRPVDSVLPGHPREEPLPGHAVVPALLWYLQGLLCPEAATEELTSGGLAHWLVAFCYYIIYKYTHTSMFFQTKYYQITYNLIKLIYLPAKHLMWCLFLVIQTFWFFTIRFHK